MVQAGHNWRFVAAFVGVVSVVAWTVSLLVAGLIARTNVVAALMHLGMATTAASFAAIILNRYLWRLPLVRQLLEIPDLSGRWEGWSFRTLENEWRPSAHEITQRALDISAEAWGPVNWSRGICAAIVTDRLGGTWELIWTYKTEVISPPAKTGDTHAGTHYLRMSQTGGRRYLQGRYVNDRVRSDQTQGSVGYIRLVWVGHSLKQSLSFEDEASWSMPKPQAAPTTAGN